MPTITSTGVGSGLDVGSVVTSLMELERQPLKLLQGRADTIQTRLSAFSTLQGQLAALGDVAARLAEPAAWQPLRVDSSRAEAVTATATTASSGGGAATGTYRLQVQQLAQGQVLASREFAATTAPVGTGTLHIELGTTDAGVFTPGAAATMHVAIAPGSQTLAGVRDAINAARGAVTASIVGSGAQARLVLRGPTGAEQSMRVSVDDDDGNAQDAAGLSALSWNPAAPGAGTLTQAQGAQDALFTVDGLAQRSPTNQVESAVQGLSITLRQVTTAPVELGVNTETMAVRKNINDVVGAYNSLVKLLQQQTQADPSGKRRGALQADSTAVGLMSQLREIVRGVIGGAAGGTGPASLSAIGLEVLRDGTLSIQEARLAPALAAPASLARLFSNTNTNTGSNGLAVRLKEWCRRATGEDGALTARVQGLRSAVDRNQKDQDAVQDKLARTEARLRAQYQRLDSDMTRLNARMTQMRSSLGLGNSD